VKVLRPASVVVAVIALAGCGSSHARRNAVNAYFAQVDRAEAPLMSETGQIDNALRAFSPVAATLRERSQLAWAERQIGKTLARVRRIEPPPEARPLHADLVRVLSLQQGTAHELAWMARFRPAYSTALSPLPAAGTKLGQDIAAVGKAPAHGPIPPTSPAKALDAYGAAFARYGQSLRGVLAAVAALSPPPELRPAWLSERQKLQASVALCASIAKSLSAGKVDAADASIKQLFTIGAVGETRAVSDAQAAAVRAYNARIRQIASLSGKVQNERQALVKKFG
jgi:hypothetical protein